jgi:hypothetical protein
LIPAASRIGKVKTDFPENSEKNVSLNILTMKGLLDKMVCTWFIKLDFAESNILVNPFSQLA